MWKQFDELLIQKAAVYGWSIRLSRFVEARYWQWLEEEEDGPELARRFDEAVRHRSLVRRGEIQGSIVEREWAEAKKNGVEELRRLMRQYKAEFNKRRRTPEFTETCEWYMKTIDESPKNFPFWWDNLEALLFALNWARKNDPTRAERITLGLEGAAALFDLVAARSENLSESYARRMISETAKL
jgi:hypothetical protein